jgi:diadenosine tetraphosphate (Ap4A) HIT family hydrolase
LFTLHTRLAADTFLVAEGSLSSVLLMNNEAFPWLILVPRIEAASEIIDLKDADRITLMDEITQASRCLKLLFSPDKLNVAALGNQVPQLHIHVIARFKTDTAWPNPVWGGATKPYGDATDLLAKLRGFYAGQA